MRARFFAQNLRRFVNSDVIIGSISNAITLNCYAYANGNPVSNVDPFGLSVLDWVNAITEVAVAAVAVGAAVAVIAGTGGIVGNQFCYRVD